MRCSAIIALQSAVLVKLAEVKRNKNINETLKQEANKSRQVDDEYCFI